MQLFWCISWEFRTLNWFRLWKQTNKKHRKTCIFHSLEITVFASLWLIVEERVKERKSSYMSFLGHKKFVKIWITWRRSVVGHMASRLISPQSFPAFHYHSCASCLQLSANWKPNSCFNMMLNTQTAAYILETWHPRKIISWRIFIDS